MPVNLIAAPPPGDEVSCSFCGKDDDEAFYVRGVAAAICDGCVELAVDLLRRIVLVNVAVNRVTMPGANLLSERPASPSTEEEVAFWRTEALARLQMATWLHKGLVTKGEDDRAADLRVNTIMPTLAALDRIAPMPGERIPAEVFHPGEFLADEMAARGWSDDDVAARMSNAAPSTKDYIIDALTVQAIREQWSFPDDPYPWIGRETAAQLGAAFDVSPEYFLYLDRAWHAGLGIIEDGSDAG